MNNYFQNSSGPSSSNSREVHKELDKLFGKTDEESKSKEDEKNLDQPDEKDNGRYKPKANLKAVGAGLIVGALTGAVLFMATKTCTNDDNSPKFRV